MTNKSTEPAKILPNKRKENDNNFEISETISNNPTAKSITPNTGRLIIPPTLINYPKYTGLNKVNPLATILSGIMMLRYNDERAAANRLEAAIRAVVAEGKSVTYDLKPDRNDPTATGTSEMADAIIARLKER